MVTWAESVVWKVPGAVIEGGGDGDSDSRPEVGVEPSPGSCSCSSQTPIRRSSRNRRRQSPRRTRCVGQLTEVITLSSMVTEDHDDPLYVKAFPFVSPATQNDAVAQETLTS